MSKTTTPIFGFVKQDYDETADIDDYNDNFDKAETALAAARGLVHTQSAAAEVWTITHNLNRYPSVTVVDSSGAEVLGNVRYVSANQITVTCGGATGGVAYLN